MASDEISRRQMNELLTALQIKGDVYMKQLMLEKKRVKDLDDALKTSTEQIRQYREHTKQSAIDVLNLHRFTRNKSHQRADGLNPTKAADALQQKQVAILETQLNKLRIRDAEAQHANDGLKKDINDLRKKRMIINSSHARYEQWLLETRRKIKELTEKASKANEGREKTVERRNELIRRNEEERKRFEEDYHRMGNFIDMQNSLFEESISQAAKGMEKNLKAALSEKGGALDEAYALDAPKHPLLQRLKEVTAENEAERQSYEQLMDELRKKKMAFEELKRVSGIECIDELVTIFRRNEEDTFSLFNYIQTVQQEIEWTLESHASMVEEMKVFEQQQRHEDEQREKVILSNNQRLQGTARQNREAREGATEVSLVVDRIAKKVQSLFFKLQCDQMYGTEAQKSSGGSKASGGGPKAASSSNKDKRQGGGGTSAGGGKLVPLSGNSVNDSNILEYMKVIEERLVQIVQEYTRKMSLRDDNPNAVIPHVGPSLPMNDMTEQCLLIRPPDSNGDDEGDDGLLSDEKPVPLEHLRRKVKDRIANGIVSTALTNTGRNNNNKESNKESSSNAMANARTSKVARRISRQMG